MMAQPKISSAAIMPYREKRCVKTVSMADIEMRVALGPLKFSTRPGGGATTRQVLSKAGHHAPAVRRCVTQGNKTECTETEGHWIPPTYRTVDDNEDARDSDSRACYFENGWHPEQKS